MKRLVLILLFMFLLSSCAPAAPLDDSDFSVTNDVITYTLGDDYPLPPSEDCEKYSIGDHIKGFLKYKHYNWDFVDISISCTGSDFYYDDLDEYVYTISALSLRNSNYATKRGVRIGSSARDVFRAYGRIVSEKENGTPVLKYEYNNKIMAFDLDLQDRVKAIFIRTIYD